MKVVAYHRVSTAKQGTSGLGLQAPQKAIEDFTKQCGGEITGSFTEVESGKNDERPELEKALHMAKVTGSTLVIAKLDRLSRNASFLLNLNDSGVEFIATDLPKANDLTVGVMALVAQQEREAASNRTKEALAAAKARGVKLGNPNGAAALRRADRGNEAGIAAIKSKADRHAMDLEPVIEVIRAEGLTSLGDIANALNSRGFLTRRGGQWHKTTVKNIVERIKKLGEVEEAH